MKMKVLAALVALACASGFAVAQDKSKKSSGPKAVTVKLVPQNRSGESGSAKLTPMGEDKTQVEISLKGGPKGTPQPAHIHEGSCAKLNPQPKYPLQNVVDGKSTSEVPVGIAQLTKGGLSINVHKSADELKQYVACGPIGAKKQRAGK
jgi:Cu/Zn superoxide dismutase